MKEGVEVTLTQPRTYLEIQLNSEVITKNKQLNKSKRKASKPCNTQKNQLQHNLPTPAQQKTRGGGQTDPQITSWWERTTKKDPTRTKNQRHKQSQQKPQPKISKIRRSRRL